MLHGHTLTQQVRSAHMQWSCCQVPTPIGIQLAASWLIWPFDTAGPAPRADRSLSHKHLSLCLQRAWSCRSELWWAPPFGRKAWGWRTLSLPLVHGWPTASSCLWSWGKSTWNPNHCAKPGRPAASPVPFAGMSSRQQPFWHHHTTLLTAPSLSRAPAGCCYLLLRQVVQPGEGYIVRTFVLPVPVGRDTLV